MSARFVLAFACLIACGCSRSNGERRDVKVRGLPVCAKGDYARRLVVRIDRDAALFEEPFTVALTLDASPTKGIATLSVPRTHARVALRVGLCTATSLGTWDCKAPSWIASTETTLDARADAATVDLPAIDAPCADGSTGRPARY